MKNATQFRNKKSITFSLFIVLLTFWSCNKLSVLNSFGTIAEEVTVPVQLTKIKNCEGLISLKGRIDSDSTKVQTLDFFLSDSSEFITQVNLQTGHFSLLAKDSTLGYLWAEEDTIFRLLTASKIQESNCSDLTLKEVELVCQDEGAIKETSINVALGGLCFLDAAWLSPIHPIESEYGIIYGTATNFAGKEESLRLDVSYPVEDASLACGRPLMVFVHGGAWLFGSRNAAKELREDFAKRGYVTAAMDYRLGMFHTSEAKTCGDNWGCFNMADESEWYRANYRAIQDVNGAIRYLVNNAASYNINPDNIFVVGSSAGGFISMGVGFMDDSSEVLSEHTRELADVLAPNQIHEDSCIIKLGIANSIAEMDLSRPDLGSYLGTLNFPATRSYTIRGVGNLYGGVFNNILKNHGANTPPALYTYHQPCDVLIPYTHARILEGYNSCRDTCGEIAHRPYVYGGKGITNLIDSMNLVNTPTSDYFFDSYQRVVECDASCHQLDNEWLRLNNMALYFAKKIVSCEAVNIHNTVAPITKNNFIKSAYPNPAMDEITISLHQAVEDMQIEIFDVLGRKQQQSLYGFTKELVLNLDKLQAGVYFVKLKAVNVSETIKISIENKR